jgi:hypothetical protein
MRYLLYRTLRAGSARANRLSCRFVTKDSPGANLRASPEGVRRKEAPNKDSPGANLRASPEGVRRKEAPNKMIGKMDRHPCRRSRFDLSPTGS